MTGTEEFVEELIRYYGRLSNNERPDLDFDIQSDTPWEVLRRCGQEVDPELAWTITKKLLTRAPDSALGYIAAGPIEDLISFHGIEFIDRLEEYASRNPRLVKALEAVIVDRWVPEEVRDRLRIVCPNLRVDELE